jgi:hypothetical protein
VAILLGAGARAPSLHNSQPWRFQVIDHEVWLFSDPTRRLPHIDPDGRQQIISCGACLLNLRLAMRHLGFEPHVELQPPGDSNLLATVRREVDLGPAGGSDRRLYEQISERRTTRSRFGTEPIPPAIGQLLRYVVATEGASLHPIGSRTERGVLAHLLVRAIRGQLADPLRTRETLKWLHSKTDTDGMRSSAWEGVAFPVPGLYDPNLPGADDWESRIPQLVDQTALFILSTPGDDRPDWMKAGQAVQRLLLTASRAGLAASFLDQTIESPPLRAELAESLGLRGYPQLMLRIGYPWLTPTASARRSLEDTIVDAT